MQSNDLKVVDGDAVGAWIKPRLGGEFGAVTLEVPKGYEAYARVFHPSRIFHRDGDPPWKLVRWADVAKACGTIAHREMQWHALVGSSDPDNFTGSKWTGSDPSLGEMDLPTLDALRDVLAAHTADPASCLFGLCTIQGWEDQFTRQECRHQLKLPMGRDHIVLTGALSALDQIVFDASKPHSSRAITVAYKGEGPRPEPDPSFFSRRRAPNLIWPADRSWLVASEVDFDSTLVGGGAELIAAIVGSSELEAWQVEPTDSLAADADKINGGEEES
jgi:hypothetical protein